MHQSSLGDKIVYEGETISFSVAPTDFQARSPVYSVSNLPFGAIFDYKTGTFSWTPSYLQSGTYPDIEFQITDGNLTYSRTVTIIVRQSREDGDINGDGTIDIHDMEAIRLRLGEKGTAGWIPEDLTGDGVIDVLDMISISHKTEEANENSKAF